MAKSKVNFKVDLNKLKQKKEELSQEGVQKPDFPKLKITEEKQILRIVPYGGMEDNPFFEFREYNGNFKNKNGIKNKIFGRWQARKYRFPPLVSPKFIGEDDPIDTIRKEFISDNKEQQDSETFKFHRRELSSTERYGCAVLNRTEKNNPKLEYWIFSSMDYKKILETISELEEEQIDIFDPKEGLDLNVKKIPNPKGVDSINITSARKPNPLNEDEIKLIENQDDLTNVFQTVPSDILSEVAIHYISKLSEEQNAKEEESDELNEFQKQMQDKINDSKNVSENEDEDENEDENEDEDSLKKFNAIFGDK